MGTPVEEFGPYVVYEQLGLGGMATVHRAETQGIAGFSKQVALKRMLPSVANDKSLVQSFIREARLASHLRHANVAQTYDLGKVGETYFIAMELVPGRNLREILKHCAAVVGNMPLPIVLNIVNQICDALDYAHDLCDDSGSPLGIIHRDVSPANIIVSEGGVVKLIDFGIAKASARTGMNTMSGTIKGKFGYMAPEYLMGSIDARADLFALGVIAHELLANRPLFQGKDDMDTLYRVKDMPILPPSRINPKVPPELDSIVMTALDRNPDQRWQRANALRQALTTETKRLGLEAHNSQVTAWIEQAFHQTRKKAQFEEDSEPVISISSGTTELPRAASLAAMAKPRREVPDEFSSSDGMETLVKSTGTKPLARASEPAWKTKPSDLPTLKAPGNAQPDDWNVATDMTTPSSDAMDRPIGGMTGDGDWKLGTDVPTQSVRKSAPLAATPEPQVVETRRDSARTSSPHIVQRNTPPRNTPPRSSREITEHADQERTLRDPVNQRVLDDASEDDIRTLPARSERRDSNASPGSAEDEIPTLPPRTERPSAPPPARAERPSQPMPLGGPPGLAPRSDAQARTMMIEPARAEPPRQPASPPMIRTLPGTGVPGGVVSATTVAAQAADAHSAAASNARTTPRLLASELAHAGSVEHRPPLDDLDARGERPSASKVLANLNPQSSIVKTKVDAGKRSGASNFLLAVLVLIAAGGAAAVVYFALPYLT